MAVEFDCDSLWYGADVVTMRDGRYNLIEDGAIAVKNDRIVWVGPRKAALAARAGRRIDFGGGIVTPGLIDCHTHLVFGGDRSAEFEQRLNGASYAQIAAGGGGILSTVRATRAASAEELAQSARRRIACLLAEGVTTLEIKSGYGLDEESELRMLQVIRTLARELPVEIHATCLAAHAVPPEYRDDPDGWIDVICQRLLPHVKAQGLADSVDAFCEYLAFSAAQVERVFACARQHALPVRLHAAQLSFSEGCQLAARFQALSADHLEYATERDAQAMAAQGTVAVLLPGAFYLLRETQLPPIDAFRRHGVPMALASDANPGTSPALSLRLMLNMGCTLFGMTPEEALAGVTLHAAGALGLTATHGSLEAGKVANFVHWPLSRPAELTYWLGGQLPCQVIYHGEMR
ncbi:MULTISPECIES: imidazolonepropionase [Brenneria]|uniref:Imidazolonepropionase n=1 Tax=Brenneria nigrifluens DSM 30175 = ATCC 13028 TaxID=1121120 RepID=A0A2U1UFF8_9GAMM|nr:MULTISPECIES: imidazolonepropionase [Brenneria]EHD19998.1 Imidazolonepropionase [Brenneria sp. EniD312]PWC20391.1 imidazolonepropionase [Brenneria nigrifluens] [Brenneria nigrifluens DSM 30175 = ATCC 13028]QCR03237.1 imidazolonepropionase [Brenneria nigrifluens] [Brenneria nigrifluens DSM 30175 = ATCC 13028]